MDNARRATHGLSARIVGCFAAISTLIALLGIGLLVCCLPATTQILAEATVDDARSPYSHDQLVQSAVNLRNLTIDGASHVYAGGKNAEATLFQATGNDVAGLPDDVLLHYGVKPTTVQAFTDAEELGRYVGNIDTALGIDDDALSHLEDVNKVTSWALPLFTLVLVVCLVLNIVLFLLNKTVFCRVMRMAPVVIAGIFVLLGVWGAVDFYGLFSVFHGLLFPQGNWTFSADSLLICSLPTGFWMYMAAVWLVCTLGACIICLVLSFKAAPGRNGRR